MAADEYGRTPLTVAGRHRIEFSMGYWDRAHSRSPFVIVQKDEKTRVENLVGALSYSYWASDRLSAVITLRGMIAEITSIETADETLDHGVVVASAMFGLRVYPVSSARIPLRPYLTASVGPYLGIETKEEFELGGGTIVKTSKTMGTYGAFLGGGLDIQFGRHLMFGVQAGYDAMADFQERLRYEDNYSGFELTAGVSVLFG